jgi:hypothetical protein
MSSSKPLFITGTAFGNWQDLAKSICNGAGTGGENPYHRWHLDAIGPEISHRQLFQKAADATCTLWPSLSAPAWSNSPAWSEFGCWSIDHFAEQIPQARFLLFYEPIELSAVGTAAGEAAHNLEIWLASAKRLVSAIHRHRGRCHLFSASECRANPDAFREWLAGNLGLQVQPATPANSTATLDDDLPSILLKLLSTHDTSLRHIENELHNLAQPLAGSTPPPQVAAAETIAVLRAGLAASARIAKERAGWAEKQTNWERKYADACEMLLGELQNAHKESEDFFEKLENSTKKLDRLKTDLERANLRAGENRFRVGRVKLKGFREKQPHSHADFVFHNVKLPGKTFDELPLRLLLHHGRAGLALFRDSQRPYPPLHRWTPSGTERGREFMAILPEDIETQRFLNTCTGSDITFLRFAAECLRDFLGTALVSPPKGARNPVQVRRWRRVAQQLLESLDRGPQKLRYDNVHWRDTASDGHISFSVINISYGQRLWSEVRLAWTPGRKLDILISADGDVPLECWPRKKDLTPESAFTIPLDAKGHLKSLAKTLTASDRRFCALLLRSLPDFVHHGIEQGKIPTAHRSALRAAATQAAASVRVLEPQGSNPLLSVLRRTCKLTS